MHVPQTALPPWVPVFWWACSGQAGEPVLRPLTARALIPEHRGAGPGSLQHRYLLILIHTIQEKLGCRAFWSNHKDMGVGHEQEGRKWNFKKSVLKKITLCKPDFCEPGTCNSETLCYSSEATVNRGSVSGWQGLQNQNTPGRWESSLPGVNCEQPVRKWAFLPAGLGLCLAETEEPSHAGAFLFVLIEQ